MKKYEGKNDFFYLHERFEEEFNCHFQENAEKYWELYVLHHKEGISYEKLSMQYFYSATSIRNICNKIENFLQNPRIFLCEIGEYVRMPNEFIDGFYRLSLNGNKMFLLAIGFWQTSLGNKIKREQIIALSSQYKNRERRDKLFNELRDLRILLRNGENVQIFDRIEDKRGDMIFEFTEQALNYIDIYRRLAAMIWEKNQI